MNTIKNIWRIVHLTTIMFIIILAASWQCGIQSKLSTPYSNDTIITNATIVGIKIEIYAQRGKQHNKPLMAVWVTDTNFKYIETLYVARSIAKGEFGYGNSSEGVWKPGPLRRPAALPVWAHSRGVQESDGLYVPTPETPIIDGITGATPINNLLLYSNTSVNQKAYVFFEVNQPWDWNDYWTNNKFPDDENYKTSCQPSLIYKAIINLDDKTVEQNFELIGHGHYSGKNGEINPDLTTITTAKDIYNEVRINIR